MDLNAYRDENDFTKRTLESWTDKLVTDQYLLKRHDLKYFHNIPLVHLIHLGCLFTGIPELDLKKVLLHMFPLLQRGPEKLPAWPTTSNLTKYQHFFISFCWVKNFSEHSHQVNVQVLNPEENFLRNRSRSLQRQ